MKSPLSSHLSENKKPYVTLAEENLAQCWSKDKAQTYALLAIAEQLTELNKNLSRRK